MLMPPKPEPGDPHERRAVRDDAPAQGKRGVRIEREKYDEMRRALMRVIPKRREGVAFGDLPDLVAPHLSSDVFSGSSVQWYVVTVKQDLEARGLIEQVEGAKPQHVRRIR